KTNFIFVQVIRDAFYKEKKVDTKMSAADLVTETDHAIEKMVESMIVQKYPTHRFIGEESTKDHEKHQITDDPTWIIDPIDGTTNFVNQFNNTMYILHSITDLKKAVILFEGGASRDEKILEDKMANTHSLYINARGMRSYGSGALSICNVAAGRGQGFFEYGLHIWDFTAGGLIATEAGAVVLDPSGGELNPLHRRVLCACTKEVAQSLSKLLVHIDMGWD
ncbi:hypothetical protein EGW08_013970, partial [Elysia chlorotica]